VSFLGARHYTVPGFVVPRAPTGASCLFHLPILYTAAYKRQSAIVAFCDLSPCIPVAQDAH